MKKPKTVVRKHVKITRTRVFTREGLLVALGMPLDAVVTVHSEQSSRYFPVTLYDGSDADTIQITTEAEEITEDYE